MKKPLLLTSLLAACSLQAAFEKFSLTIEDSVFTDFTVLQVEPLTLEFFGFVDDSFEFFLGQEGATGFDLAYDSREGFPAGLATTLQGDPLAVGGDLFFVTAVDESATGGNRRADGRLARFNGASTAEYGPTARELFGGGTTSSPFHYRMGGVSADGSVVMVGYDNIFAHFIVLIDSSGGTIIAQESETEIPGTREPFTRFGAAVQISPDGSLIAFRGLSEITGTQGLYLWNGSDLSEVVTIASDLPGSSGETFSSLMDSGVESYFGADNTLYLISQSQGLVYKYKDGSLSRVVGTGDELDAGAITGIGRFAMAPDGALFTIADVSDGVLLRYEDDALTVYHSYGDEVEDGYFINPGSFFVNTDGVYFPASKPGSGVVRIYRRPLAGGSLEAVTELDVDVFGQAPSIQSFMTDGSTVLIGTRDGLYRGTQDDFTEEGGSPDGSLDFLLADSGEIGGSWYWLTWFGYFSVGTTQWLFHNEHEWLYVFPGSTLDAFYFWDRGMNSVLYTNKNFYPTMYRFSDGQWIYYARGSKNPRSFVDLETGVWEEQ